jgi:hypothetical protein
MPGGNTFYGDAISMSGDARGGDDVAVLLGPQNVCFGDAGTMSGNAVGGNDVLTGGTTATPFNNGRSVFTILSGDAGTMSDSAKGGNDVLSGESNTGSSQPLSNLLVGDARQLSGSSEGGNDILIAGTAAPGCTITNDMWGDGQLSDTAQGGKDQFVFRDAGSMTVGTQNTIEDFSQSQHDQIKFVDVADVHSFNDLVIAQSATDTVITAGADQVTLHNFTNSLTANDFLFVG